MTNLDLTVERLCERIEQAPAQHKNELRLQLIRIVVFRRMVQPHAPRLEQPKAPPALKPRRKTQKPAGWRCADCGTTSRQSLKNGAYCVACAQWQPIGAMV